MSAQHNNDNKIPIQEALVAAILEVRNETPYEKKSNSDVKSKNFVTSLYKSMLICLILNIFLN